MRNDFYSEAYQCIADTKALTLKFHFNTVLVQI